MVIVMLQPPALEIHNEHVRVTYDAEKGVWRIRSAYGAMWMEGGVVVILLGNQEVRADAPCHRHAMEERGRDALGEYARLKVTHTGLAGLDELVWTATLRANLPYAIIQATARGARGPVRRIEVMNITGKDRLRFGSNPAGWMRFADSGGQGGTGVAPFFAQEKASHGSSATLAVHDTSAKKTLLMGWLSWAASNPSLHLSGDKAEGMTGAVASCGYYPGAVPPSEVATEPLLIGFEPDPLLALEQYAQEVKVRNNPPIRKDTVMGWLSWYCSRLKMTEQFVLDNARVIADNFRVYGVDTMQVDHGWEYKDIVGHWVANDRFPHGMKWLGDELKKLGLKLGVWIAVGCVSEYAPFYAEHPEALIHKKDGQLRLYCEKWAWPPHGKVFNLDPTHPAAQAHYRKSLQGLMDAGCRYYKVDFIGSSGATEGVFHDPNRPRGNPMIRYEMQQIREIVGPDSWLRYCSSPSNVYCGIVNIGGATSDIGNAAGRWDWLAKYHQQLGSCWYKHRTFWHNEPDALIVGDRGETENEARMRCAWLVMSGGVVALGDDLTKIAPERMALIPKCLPPYDVAARPLDLFEHVPARMWDLHVKTAWDDYHVLTLFNFEEKEQEMAIPVERLGFAGAPLVGWEFWTQTKIAQKDGEMRVRVPARDCRIVAVRRAAERPQVLATDMHLTMGAVELSSVKWDDASCTLSGLAHRAPGVKGKIFIHVPEGWQGEGEVAVAEVRFAGKDASWSATFKRAR